jgi:hypothetical protein
MQLTQVGRAFQPAAGPNAQRLPSQKTRLLDQPLFHRLGFLQCALVAFDRQHDRRHPLDASPNAAIIASSVKA